MKSERALTRPEGLPRRAWYVHQIYAPGFYTGYGVKTLPAVREALEQRNWKEATDKIPVVASTIEGFAAEIDKATAVLSTK
jgi:N-acetylated-alpha-linked acidic dipeptidase